jgi:hypothetical protein
MRLRAPIVRLAVTCLLAFALSCGRRAPAPEAVPVDRVNCARCGMMISSERQSAEWVARPPDESTPMGYGVVAFADRAVAATRDREGQARTWQELVRELGPEPPGSGGQPKPR